VKGFIPKKTICTKSKKCFTIFIVNCNPDALRRRLENLTLVQADGRTSAAAAGDFGLIFFEKPGYDLQIKAVFRVRAHEAG
jgi:hypothetical protein